MSLLVIERGQNTGTRIPLVHFPITVGRDQTNQVVINDTEVSRNHLRIKQRGKLFVVEDLDSRNGTYVNGDRILNSIIQSGDKILIGNTELIFLTADSSVHFATEIMNMDMIVAEDLGLHAPINVSSKDSKPKFTPVRLNELSSIDLHAFDLKSVKEVFDLHANVLLSPTLEEAAHALLKGIGQLLPQTARAAYFAWQKQSRHLVPKATRHFKRKGQFHLSQRSFEDVLARKHGILLQGDNPQTTQTDSNRLILPMTHADEVIAVIHMESDSPKNTFPQKDIERVQALIMRSASIFDGMMLKLELDSWMVGMVETMIATLEAKDTYTHGHSERVSRYSIAIADELRLTRELKKLLLMSALCHDIGKIGIPDAILKKASILSAEEYEEMKLHPTIGAEIVSNMPNARRFISGVKYHHEKWDGTGYPEGLVGEDIPFFGRIVGVADVYDAMVSGRTYSGFLDQSDAAERLCKEKELFDPEILKAFQRAFDKGTLTLKTNTDNNELPEKTSIAPLKKTTLPKRLSKKKETA